MGGILCRCDSRAVESRKTYTFAGHDQCQCSRGCRKAQESESDDGLFIAQKPIVSTQCTVQAEDVYST